MSYNFFENTECEFYPCHNCEKINCLFCFCPLYESDCGGDYELIKNSKGEEIKDCSNCVLPHSENGYDYVIEQLKKK